MKTMMWSALFCAIAAAASAASFSGKWVIQTSSGGGTVQQTVIVLNQVANEVEGSIVATGKSSDASPVNVEILGGKVEGETLTFYVWTGLDRPRKVFYKGTLSDEGISFVVTGGEAGTGSGGPRRATARRSR